MPQGEKTTGRNGLIGVCRAERSGLRELVAENPRCPRHRGAPPRHCLYNKRGMELVVRHYASESLALMFVCAIGIISVTVIIVIINKPVIKLLNRLREL